MKSNLLRGLGVAFIAVMLSQGSSCISTVTTPATPRGCMPEDVCLNVGFFKQLTWTDPMSGRFAGMCVPAVITMWANYEQQRWGGGKIQNPDQYQREVWLWANGKGYTQSDGYAWGVSSAMIPVWVPEILRTDFRKF